jgi:6-phosphogluconolactonase
MAQTASCGVHRRALNTGNFLGRMKHSLRRFGSETELALVAASDWIEAIQQRVAAGRRFSVGLSGGRIPLALFREAVVQSLGESVPWHAVDFFWVDERCVPTTDDQSNFKFAQELLLKPLQIPGQNIFRLRGEIPQPEAVALASSQLRENVPGSGAGLPEVDLILLGMGEDGHTASLFPEAGPEVVDCTEPFLAVHSSPKPPPERITMSYPQIAAAKDAWVLIAGPGKEAALADVLSDSPTLPLGRVIQMRRTTRVLLA